MRRFLHARGATHGARQARWLWAVDAHFRALRPDAVVTDEDATPTARAVVAAARRHGASTYVLQHGAPCCRFGFAPLVADRFLAWGPASQSQLVKWGLPAGRIELTGSPRHDALRRRWGFPPRKRPRPERPHVLLLTTVPPRDHRPDSAALNLTTRTYAEMLRWVCRCLDRLDQPAKLTVKLHPRSPDDPILSDVLADYPRLRPRVVRTGPLARWVRRADCVLSCISSAGVDAATGPVPVIQLLPPGAADLLPHQRWGMFGTARSEDRVRQLLAQVLSRPERPQAGPNTDAFGPDDGLASVRIADCVLAPVPRGCRLGRLPVAGASPTGVGNGPDYPEPERMLAER